MKVFKSLVNYSNLFPLAQVPVVRLQGPGIQRRPDPPRRPRHPRESWHPHTADALDEERVKALLGAPVVDSAVALHRSRWCW